MSFYHTFQIYQPEARPTETQVNMFYLMTIPFFQYRDNSVHLHECSPFWVGIFITDNKENYHVYCFT